MKHRRLLIVLLVGVNLLGIVVAPLLVVRFGNETRGSAALLLCSLALSQANLVAFWAALAGRPTPWRLIAAILACVAWLYVVAAMDRWRIWF
jgi:hypothetical protein